MQNFSSLQQEMVKVMMVSTKNNKYLQISGICKYPGEFRDTLKKGWPQKIKQEMTDI